MAYSIRKAVKSVIDDAVSTVAGAGKKSSAETVKISNQEVLQAIYALTTTATPNDGAFRHATGLVDLLTEKQAYDIYQQLREEDFLARVCISPTAKPNVRLAQWLWRKLRLRLPGFVNTWRLLRANPFLNVKTFHQQRIASSRDSLAKIGERQAKYREKSANMEAWLNLLREEGFGPDSVAVGELVYENIFTSNDEQTQHWLVKHFGNFVIKRVEVEVPVPAQSRNVWIIESARTPKVETQLIYLFDKWPATSPEAIALYGMYPSLDPNRAYFEYLLQHDITTSYRVEMIFVSLMVDGAKDWNIQRAVDLGIPRQQIAAVMDEIVRAAFLYANVDMLDYLRYAPPRINLKDRNQVTEVAEALAQTRRDMWNLMVTRNEARVVFPIAMQILGITEF